MAEEKEYTLADIEKLLKKRMKRIDGSDTDNKEYSGITALWKYIFPEFRKPSNKKAKTSHDASANCGEWYSKANEYWESEENCPITDGKDFHSLCMYRSPYLAKSIIRQRCSWFRWCVGWLRCFDRNGRSRLESLAGFYSWTNV